MKRCRTKDGGEGEEGEKGRKEGREEEEENRGEEAVEGGGVFSEGKTSNSEHP